MKWIIGILLLLCGIVYGVGDSADPNAIGQFGITWYFDKNLTTDGAGDTYQYGTYANGDYWVLDEGSGVNITYIDPPYTVSDTPTEAGGTFSNRVQNGSMINPIPCNKQSYDSGAGGYLAAFTVNSDVSEENPLTITISTYPQSLISTDSTAVVPTKTENPRLDNAAILTIVGSVPAAGTFRPPYAGVTKPAAITTGDIVWANLATLTPVAGTPVIATEAARFERPWLDHKGPYPAAVIYPTNNMPNYGREIARYTNIACLLLNLDYTQEQKQTLLYRIIQLGIDNWGCAACSETMVPTYDTYQPYRIWYGAGTMGHGRKLPIVLAATVLEHAGMTATLAKSGDYMWDGTDADGYPNPTGAGLSYYPSDYVQFGEEQFHYVMQLHVDICNNATGGVYANWAPSRNPLYVSAYEAGDIGVPDWNERTGDRPNECSKYFGATYADYRLSSGSVLIGTILACHIMDAKTIFNQDSAFDYADRHIKVLLEDEFPLEPWFCGTNGIDQGKTLDERFVWNMWEAYRDDYPPVWGETVEDPNELADTTPPEPDPMTWSVVPSAGTSTSEITMTATTATDPNGVEYYFDETSGNSGGTDSGWQASASYTDSGLAESTQYTYRVRARDLSENNNTTEWSSSESATTASGGGGSGGGIPETGSTIYVDPNVIGGLGDGSSLANAYSSLQAAITAEATDLDGTGGITYKCYDTSGTTPDVVCQIGGHTNSSADDPIIIEICDANYKISVADTEEMYLYITDEAVSIYGYQGNTLIDCPSADGNGASGLIRIYGLAGSYCRLGNFRITGPDNDDYYMRGVIVDDDDTLVEICNVCIDNMGQHTASRGITTAAGSDAYLSNVRIDNCYYGARAYGAAANVYAINCIVTEATGGCFAESDGGNMDTTYCTSDDTTAESFDTGDTCTNSATPTETGTYRLAAADTAWDKSGLDLTSYGRWFLPAEDVDGKARSVSYWGIGWSKYTDETVALCDAPVWVTEPYFVTNATIFMEATPDPNATEYYFEASEPAISSGWTSDPNWLMETVSLDVLIEFRYKARNSDQVESDWSETVYLQWAPTEIVRYVDATSGNDTTGDGSSGTPWKTMSKAESEIDDYGENSDGDLTVMGETYPHGCYVTLHVSNGTDTTAVTWAGNTTDATRYISVEGDGTYTMEMANAFLLTISDNYIRVDGFTVYLTDFNINGYSGIRVANITGTNEFRLTNMIIRGPNANATYYCYGVVPTDADSNIIANNCLFYDWCSHGVSFAMGYYIDGSIHIRAYNCTVVNCSRGFSGSHTGNILDVKNCIVSNATNGCYYLGAGGSTLRCTNCTSDDATVTTYDTGSTCTANVTPAFTPASVGLYRLAKSDTHWIDQGADLSEDDYWVLDDVDIDEEARTGTWDIGWDEYGDLIRRMNLRNYYERLLQDE